MKKILIIDNYDSFTYNLVETFRQTKLCWVEVYKNDMFPIDYHDDFDGMVLSPGPDLPENAGRLTDITRQWMFRKPVLGICLGHQAIIEIWGGKLKKSEQVAHGISSSCIICDESERVFHEIPSPFKAGRYHSWMADEMQIPSDLKVTSRLKDGTIMSVRHHHLNIRGIQFHPESIMTPFGKKMLENWLQLCL